MNTRHILLALLMASIWGANFSVMKIGMQGVSPLLFACLRSLVVVPLVFFIPKPRTSWKVIIAIGLLIGTIKLPLMIVALHFGVGAGLSSLVGQSQVFFTVLLAMLLFNEQPKLQNWIGMLIAFSGIALIGIQIGGETSYLGLFIILLAAFFWAISNIITQHAKDVNMLHLTVWMNLIPPVPLFGFAVMMEGWESTYASIINFSGINILSVLYAGFFAGLLGYTLWGTLLRKYPASTVAPFSLLVPVFALSFAYLMIEEVPTPLSLMGGLCVILGLIINQIKFRIRKKTSSRPFEN